MPKDSKSTPTPEAAEKSRYHVEALAKGLRILSLFTREQPALSLSEISERSGLTTSTALRFVATLSDHGYLEHLMDQGLYRPAVATLKLGYAALASLDLCELAKPEMLRLHEKTAENVLLGVLAGTEIVTIERIRGTKSWSVQGLFGHRVPMHCTAPGKLMLAMLPAEELESLKDKLVLDEWGPNSVTTWEELRRSFKGIVANGYSIVDEELAVGVCSVAAPILDSNGSIIATLSLPVPKERYSLEDIRNTLAPLVVATAQEINEKLAFLSTQIPDLPRKLGAVPDRKLN